MKRSPIMLTIATIAIVNALGYGVIIPLLYGYSHRFGLSDFENGLLFSTFSLCQFLSTPVIGRLSDKYGRKPLLVISLLGTIASFLLMAVAQSGIVLFIARAIDGLTAGNLPVALAVISDTTEAKDRAKGFGIIGASFGFGFVFGPAISALTVRYSPALPFLVAASITTVAVLLTAFVLPETHKTREQEHHGPLFNFEKLWHALWDPNLGRTLAISFVYTVAFSMFIYAFQPFSVKVLGLSQQQIATMFVVFGLAGLVAQAVVLPRLAKRAGDRKLLFWTLVILVGSFMSMFWVHTFHVFIAASIVYSFVNSFVGPLTQTLLSKETDPASQGAILGVNASYVSLGMIFGPIIGGLLATITIPLPFLAGSLLVGVCAILARRIHQPVAGRQVSVS